MENEKFLRTLLEQWYSNDQKMKSLFTFEMKRTKDPTRKKWCSGNNSLFNYLEKENQKINETWILFYELKNPKKRAFGLSSYNLSALGYYQENVFDIEKFIKYEVNDHA